MCLWACVYVNKITAICLWFFVHMFLIYGYLSILFLQMKQYIDSIVV